jgi:acid stress-induced BolA-like protein IbaG/YrbA
MSKSNVKDALSEVQSALTRRLNLQSPRFSLESIGAKVSGSIISPSFRGMKDSERQRRIWDALHEEYGPESVQRVGSLLAFTPDEWDVEGNSDAEESEQRDD